jgi:hypothetical protein
MKVRVVLAIAAIALAVAPAARAASLPDLPGMGPAQKAVGGSATTTTAPATRTKPAVPASVSAASSGSQASTAEAEKTIRGLPGAGAIPVIGNTQSKPASSHSTIPGMDNLVVLAAIGSFAALGSLYLLRRLNRI